MSRPSRRVRQRLAKRLNLDSSKAIAAEQARKERQSIARLTAMFPTDVVRKVSFAKMVASNAMLSPDNLERNCANAIGLFDGQIRVYGSRLLNGSRRKVSAIEKLCYAAALEATWQVTHEPTEEKASWLTTVGFKVIRSFDLEPVLSGSTDRSVHALNTGSGPKRKPKRIKPLGQRINSFEVNDYGMTVAIKPIKGAVIWKPHKGGWIAVPAMEPREVNRGERAPKGFRTLHKEEIGTTLIKRPKG